ncbi:MAG TPA: RpiB/LacA/LacB family sugar-phosphate isomerase [Vicinamibacterales bacterium]|jgi:ribose 5-phosphate isomerase B
MKRFEIITEADARMLDVGTTVVLTPHGHITPLAQDTLRSRRITVIGDDQLNPLEAALTPVAPITVVAIGSDHTGVSLKQLLAARLRSAGLTVQDLGTYDQTPVDYPDIAAAVGRAVAAGEAEAGVVIDGGGLGSAIAANKIDGIRAAMCTDETTARYSREHNGANILCLGASLLTPDQAMAIVEVWRKTVMREPRYVRRLAKIQALERGRR